MNVHSVYNLCTVSTDYTCTCICCVYVAYTRIYVHICTLEAPLAKRRGMYHTLWGGAAAVAECLVEGGEGG